MKYGGKRQDGKASNKFEPDPSVSSVDDGEYGVWSNQRILRYRVSTMFGYFCI